MHDGWCGKLILHATSLKLASSSGYYVLDPFAFSSVGKRNQESLRRSKNIQLVSGRPCLTSDLHA